MPRVLVLILLIGLLPAPVIAAGGSSADGRESQARLEEVRREIGDLRRQLERARDRQTRLREELRSSELAIGENSRELRRIEREQREKTTELETLTRRRAGAQENLDSQRAALEEQVIANYVMGSQGRLKMILSQQDPATLGRMLRYYDYIHRARADHISVVNQTLQEIAGLEREIAREQQALARLHDEKSSSIQSLEETRRERAGVLANLESEVRSGEQALESLLEDERSLSDLVDRLRRAMEATPVEPSELAPFPSLKGKLPWPVEGEILARFGTRRAGQGLSWRGVVIGAEEGREVQAIHNGRVVFADWMRGFGLLVIIDHGQGYMSLYGHNQSLYRNVGDWVRQGDMIATVGDSGGHDRPGLYFEIRHNGTPDNPMQWCRAS